MDLTEANLDKTLKNITESFLPKNYTLGSSQVLVTTLNQLKLHDGDVSAKLSLQMEGVNGTIRSQTIDVTGRFDVDRDTSYLYLVSAVPPPLPPAPVVDNKHHSNSTKNNTAAQRALDESFTNIMGDVLEQVNKNLRGAPVFNASRICSTKDGLLFGLYALQVKEAVPEADKLELKLGVALTPNIIPFSANVPNMDNEMDYYVETCANGQTSGKKMRDYSFLEIFANRIQIFKHIPNLHM